MSVFKLTLKGILPDADGFCLKDVFTLFKRRGFKEKFS